MPECKKSHIKHQDTPTIMFRLISVITILGLVIATTNGQNFQCKVDILPFPAVCDSSNKIVIQPIVRATQGVLPNPVDDVAVALVDSNGNPTINPMVPNTIAVTRLNDSVAVGAAEFPCLYLIDVNDVAEIGLSVYTCSNTTELTKCGNGIIDEGEVCDYGSDPTCNQQCNGENKTNRSILIAALVLISLSLVIIIVIIIIIYCACYKKKKKPDHKSDDSEESCDSVSVESGKEESCDNEKGAVEMKPRQTKPQKSHDPYSVIQNNQNQFDSSQDTEMSESVNFGEVRRY